MIIDYDKKIKEIYRLSMDIYLDIIIEMLQSDIEVTEKYRLAEKFMSKEFVNIFSNKKIISLMNGNVK